jgi:hypothetical protein
MTPGSGVAKRERTRKFVSVILILICRHFIQKTGISLSLHEGLVNICNQPFTAFGVAACKVQEVGYMRLKI